MKNYISLFFCGGATLSFINDILREDLDKAVGELPEIFRIVVVLSDLEGFSYQEIADMLEVPIGTVRSRLARGRSQLQKALWAYRQNQQIDAMAKQSSPNEEAI